jgi:proline racemase
MPHIRGSAFITAEATLLFDEPDPFRFGIPLAGTVAEPSATAGA